MHVPYVGESLRSKMIRYFRYEYGPNTNVGSLQYVPLPSFTQVVVNEIAASKAGPQELALLGFLPTLATADRGRTRVVMSDGSSNSLSLFVTVGAESGTGKSRSVEEALAIFADWQSEKEDAVRKENKTRELANRAIEERSKIFMREFAKTGDVTVLEAIRELAEAKSEMLPIPQLLLNDVTDAAYAQHLASLGMAMRLETDGIFLPKKTLRVMTKAWTSENSDRKRMTSPDGTIKDPFVVDLVMTQPDFFSEFVSDREFLKSGLLGRTLVYRYQKLAPATFPSRPMKEDIRAAYRAKIRELLDASEPLEYGKKTRRNIRVSLEAERLLEQRRYFWEKDATYGGPLCRVTEFVARMAQHALRLAGCLYLAEFAVDSEEPIPLNLMETAIAMTEVFLSHTLRWTIKDYEDVSVECRRSVMLHILEKNFLTVMETELKQALRHHFDAADVNVALEILLMERHLTDSSVNQFGGSNKLKRGRPAGREFVNPYYAWNESSF